MELVEQRWLPLPRTDNEGDLQCRASRQVILAATPGPPTSGGEPWPLGPPLRPRVCPPQAAPKVVRHMTQNLRQPPLISCGTEVRHTSVILLAPPQATAIRRAGALAACQKTSIRFCLSARRGGLALARRQQTIQRLERRLGAPRLLHLPLEPRLARMPVHYRQQAEDP